MLCLFFFQLLKKLIQCGDTSCLRPLLAVASKKDRLLLQGYCHSASKRILEGLQGECTLMQAMSIAIMASGDWLLSFGQA